MNTTEIAEDFTRLCRQGELDEAGRKYWADDVISVEAMEGPMEVVRGTAGVKAKGDWWVANHEVHGMKVEGPYVNGGQFAVRFTMDLTVKATGERGSMDEIALYTVREGKIVEERFLYAIGQGQ